MTNNITGVVKSIKKDGKGLQLSDGSWYSGFKQVPCQRGDTVEIVYTQNGQWKNIKDIRVTAKAPVSSGSGSQGPEWSYRESYAKDILIAMIAKSEPGKFDVLAGALVAAQCEKILNDSLNKPKESRPVNSEQEQQEQDEEGYY